MNPHQQPAEPPEGLRRFVEAARAQPVVATRVTVEAVAAGLEHRRRRSHARRIVTLSATMAVAASLVAVGLIWPLLSDRDDGDERRGTTSTAQVDTSDIDEPTSEGPSLASAVRVRSTTDVEVRGPWSIALRDGVHEIEVDPVADHRLVIGLSDGSAGRELELVWGSLTVDFEHGEPAAVRLHNGVAAWIDEHGQRTQISVERIELDEPAAEQTTSPGDRPVVSTAAELSREAERRLAAGERDEAIAIYAQLVRKHPRASQTRAAVVDLARLLRAAGRKDEARCAYRLYLERWPDSAIHGEVESQLERLGDGPSCRGLDPR